MTVIINGTTGITNVNGTAAAPAETGTDTDSGIVYGTNSVSLATIGTTALTVDSSQNVGIGTASPSYKLDILTGGGGVYAAQFGNGTAAQGMRIVTGMDSTSSGITTAGGTRLIQFDGTNNITQFYTNTSERMRIDSSGNVGVGVTSPASKLDVADTSANGLRLSGAGDHALGFTGYASNAATQIFSIRNDGISNLYINTQNSIPLNLGVSTGTTFGSLVSGLRLDSSSNLSFNSGYGSTATAYGCRVWVNFSGVGSTSIRGSGNVSSVTYVSAGKYTVNFSSAMPDANYAVLCTTTGLGNSGGGKLLVENSSGTGGTIGRTSSAVTVLSTYSFTNPGAGEDNNAYSNNVGVFR